jgi:hypothetical protein
MVTVDGTNGNDTIQILTTGSGSRITVAGLLPSVNHSTSYELSRVKARAVL